MANRQYIGARYVPTFADPVEWDNSRSYEALTIVTHLGTSFTSKVPVPAGIAITDTSYWVETGNYNAQVELYRQQVQSLATQQTQQQSEITALNNIYNALNAAFHQVDETHADMSYLHGKTIVILGDSISAYSASSQYQTLQPNWVACLRDKVPEDCVIKNELSIPGRFITGNQGIADVMNGLEASYLDCNILIIFAGVNDYRWSREVYNGTDDNYASLKGALNMIKTNIYNKCPGANVFFVSPLKEFQNSLAPYPDAHQSDMPLILYRNMIRTFCSQNGFTYIDGYSAPMLNPAVGTMIDLYQKDGLHPNSTYAPLLCEYIYNKILTQTPVAPQKETVLITANDYASSDVSSANISIDVDESGWARLVAGFTATVTAGTPVTLMTLPARLKPYSGSFVARVVASGNAEVCSGLITSEGAFNLNPTVSGAVSISMEYRYPIMAFNPRMTPSL